MVKHRITVLVENSASGGEFLAEHGLSYFIEWEGMNILFDTGQGAVLQHNAQLMGVDLRSVDNIAISHGHYDHTGGLPGVLDLGMHPRLFLHPQAFDPKYSCSMDGLAHFIGMPDSLTEARLAAQTELIFTGQPTEIGAGLWLTGPISRINAYEDTGGAFFKDKDCKEPDLLWDDQAAFIETKNGTVVILGCAHSGVINTLQYIKKLTAERPIHLVAGGMHLMNAGSQRMEATIAELRQLDIEMLMPCHCTGAAAVARMRQEFTGRCEACPVGTIIQL